MSRAEATEPIGKRLKEHRVAAGLTQEKLAQLADVPYTTLTKIESGAIKNPSLHVISALAKALGASVDDFFMVDTFRGEYAIKRIWEDVLANISIGDQMFLTGIEEEKYVAFDKKGITEFIDEIKRRKITQKILSRSGDKYRLKGSHLEYRWIPEEYFSAVPMYVYGDRVAFVIWGPPIQSVILVNPLLAETYKKQFLFMWEHATKME